MDMNKIDVMTQFNSLGIECFQATSRAGHCWKAVDPCTSAEIDPNAFTGVKEIRNNNCHV